MSDDLLFQTHLKDIPSPAFRPGYTFSGKNNKESIIDFKDPRHVPDSELNMLKEQHRRTLTDLAKVNTHNKELKNEIGQLESKFQLKDREINDLKSQLETRGNGGRKLQERDSNATRTASRSPLTESNPDMKNPRAMGNADNVIDKLMSQNKILKREVEKLTEKLKRYEEGKGKDGYYKVAQDLPNRLKSVESSHESLMKENEELRESMRVLDGEASQLRWENISIKKNYDDLKSRYESLETTATSNKGDYSTESGANSEVGSKGYTKFSINDMKSELEGMNITWQERSSSGNVGAEEYKKIVEDIMEMYRLKNPMEIIPSIQKTEKVVQMVPKLRKIISEVAVMVFPRVGCPKDKGIEFILPALKKLCKDLDDVDVLSTLRNKLVDVLQLEKDCSNVEIIKRVDKLATLYYQSSEAKLQQSTDFRDQPENSLMMTQFNKIFGMQPSVAVFRQISKQLDDLKQFITVAKHKLKLEAEMKTEACLVHLLKLIEGGANKKDKTYNRDGY